MLTYLVIIQNKPPKKFDALIIIFSNFGLLRDENRAQLKPHKLCSSNIQNQFVSCARKKTVWQAAYLHYSYILVRQNNLQTRSNF